MLGICREKDRGRWTNFANRKYGVILCTGSLTLLILDWRLYAVMPETKEQYSDPRLAFFENQAA